MNQSINTDSKNSKEPQQKYRLGTVSIKILKGLNRFYVLIFPLISLLSLAPSHLIFPLISYYLWLLQLCPDHSSDLPIIFATFNSVLIFLLTFYYLWPLQLCPNHSSDLPIIFGSFNSVLIFPLISYHLWFLRLCSDISSELLFSLSPSALIFQFCLAPVWYPYYLCHLQLLIFPLIFLFSLAPSNLSWSFFWPPIIVGPFNSVLTIPLISYYPWLLQLCLDLSSDLPILFGSFKSVLINSLISCYLWRLQHCPGFNCWFSSAPVFQWCCSTPQGSPGVGRITFLSSPHLCFIIVFICDLFVSRDDPLKS